MNNLVKVVAVSDKGITFDDGTVMSSYHRRTARERCYIDFSDLRTVGFTLRFIKFKI